MGTGFDKPANARYFTLRFPRVLKIHNDRSFKETVSFEKLQEMASRYRAEPEESEREKTHWLERLQRSDYLIERSRSSSPCNNSDHAFKRETGFGTSGRQSAQQQEKMTIAIRFSHSSKRKMALEISQLEDLATKRPKLGHEDKRSSPER
jgi:DNA ligase 4